MDRPSFPFQNKESDCPENPKHLKVVSLPTLTNVTPFLKGLKDHSHVKELSTQVDMLDTRDVELIASMKKLEKLHVQGTRVGSLRSFSALANLKVLRLYFREYDKSDGCRFLASLPSLEELVLIGTKTDDFSVMHLRGNKHLTTLVVNANLSDDDIATLESMPNLKVLKVGNPIKSKWYDIATRRLPHVSINGVVSHIKSQQ